MDDGTYLKLNGDLHRIDSKVGYWAASEEIRLTSVLNGEFVGVWEDGDGKVWVDSAHYFTGLEEALKFARAHNQKAIWDNLNAEPISTSERVTA